MPSIYDLYEFYLEPSDLKDKAHLVQVESAKVEEMFNPRSPKKDRKVVLRFVRRRKAMILNKTQAVQMMEICETDDFTKWFGEEVVLVADRARNGKDTIKICTREDSGDADLAFGTNWKDLFARTVKQIKLSDAAAAQVLKDCEGDHRSACERLIAEYQVPVTG